MGNIFSDHNSINLEVNYWKKHRHVEPKQYAAKQQWMGQWRNQRGNKQYLENNENKNNNSKSMNVAEAVLSEKFIELEAYQKKKKRKISNKQTNPTPKGTRKRKGPKLVEGKECRDQKRSKWNRWKINSKGEWN